MSITVRVDTTEFSLALQQYLLHTRKTVVQAVDAKAGDIALRGAEAMRVAEPYEQQFPKRHRLWYALATGLTKKGPMPQGVAVRRGLDRKKSMTFIADKIFSSRKSGRNYSKAMFLVIAKQLGKKIMRLRKTSKIKNATGTKARDRDRNYTPFAVLEIEGVQESHAPLLEEAMQKGIDFVVKDIAVYVDKKIARQAARHSGRRR